MKKLQEATRSQLINKSRNAGPYKDQSKGRNRYARRVYSRQANTVSQYNKIDMNTFFKEDRLKIGIPVIGETRDYIVNMEFNGVLEDIQKRIKNNNNKLEFKVIYQALMSKFNSGDVYIGCNCLHPDTKIKLLDGTTRTIEQMKIDFDKGEKLWVYSVDEKGEFKPGEVTNVIISGEAEDFIKITLDNDYEILTTPEHLYMLRDGTYLEAEKLKEGFSLMPLDSTHKDGSNLYIKVKKVEKIKLSKTPVYDISIKDFPNFLVEGGVILHNCPDNRYRFAYFQTINDYRSGEPETRPSDITNPTDNKGAGCKHILLVLSNLNWLLKVCSVINNYIHYSKDHLFRNYADIIFPKLYGIKYQGDVQLSLEDEEDADLDTSNAYGRSRTRFKPNNPYRFTKRTPTTPENQLELDIEEEEPENNSNLRRH